VINQIGWIFFAFGMIFCWIFLSAADLTSWWRFRSGVRQAIGTVVKCEKTSFSVGGSKNRSGSPIFANYYTFVGPDGASRSGVSYGVGDCRQGYASIEFLEGNPSVSRIAGMTRAPFDLTPIFVVIFPLVGLGLAIGATRAGLRRYRIMKNGRLTLGKLESKKGTNTRINGRTVYRMTFAFAGEDGVRHVATTRTHMPEALEDDQRENMLYDPAAPSDAVMLDALPGRFTTSETGDIIAAGPLGILLAALGPLAALVVNLLCFYFIVVRAN